MELQGLAAAEVVHVLHLACQRCFVCLLLNMVIHTFASYFYKVTSVPASCDQKEERKHSTTPVSSAELETMTVHITIQNVYIMAGWQAKRGKVD